MLGETQQRHTRDVGLATIIRNIVDLGIQIPRAIIVTILDIEAGLAIVKSQSVHVGVHVTTATVVDVGVELAVFLSLSLDVDVVISTLLYADINLATVNSLDVRVQGNIVVLSINLSVHIHRKLRSH